MKSTMMSMALSTQMILRHGARIHGDSQVATFDGLKFASRTFKELMPRIESLASGLAALGVQTGERVASLCWNHQQHLEAYFAAPGMGAVLHTLNLRLFPHQLVQIIDHAEDKVLIADNSLWPLVRELLPLSPTIAAVVFVGGVPKDYVGPTAIDYEELLAGNRRSFVWPELDENAAAVLCYTTGTTGDPKGVAYSHRTIFLHSLGTLGADTFGICQADRILLLPSMFHANAWGLPFSAWLSGADLLLPGPHTKAANIRAMIHLKKPTYTALVPTLINDLLQADRTDPIDMSSFRMLVSGGSAVSPALIGAVYERWKLPVLQGWGMTETSPMCVTSIPPRDCPPQKEFHYRAKSGRPVPGVEVRLRDADGGAVPEDGVSTGELQLKGPWITGRYYKNAAHESFTDDGWLRTGDVGNIDPQGYVQITDRLKDVIKSGGEWISSVELENTLMLHASVFEAAVIGIADPRWEERPLVLIVPRPKHSVNAAELRAFLGDKVARFWLPENWAFLESLPKTSVGKIDKQALRRMFAQGQIAVERLRKAQ
jgi:fatty-acyl-CoA synthase